MPSTPHPAALVTALAASLLLILPAVPASAAPAAKTFANCTAIHAVHPAGIAKQGVTHNRVGAAKRPLVGDVTFSTALYKANRKSDRDGDGIACELS